MQISWVHCRKPYQCSFITRLRLFVQFMLICPVSLACMRCSSEHPASPLTSATPPRYRSNRFCFETHKNEMAMWSPRRQLSLLRESCNNASCPLWKLVETWAGARSAPFALWHYVRSDILFSKGYKEVFKCTSKLDRHWEQLRAQQGHPPEPRGWKRHTSIVLGHSFIYSWWRFAK